MALVHRAGLAGREEVLSLTAEEKRAAQQVFRGEIPGKGPCEHCGGLHERACPRVKRIERHPNGNLIAVTYFRKWDESGVVFPEDAYDPGDAEAPGG